MPDPVPATLAPTPPAIDTGRSVVRDVLAFCITAGFFGFIFMIVYLKWVDDKIFSILMALIAIETNVLQYYFGSSMGSASKDALLGRMAKNGGQS